MKCARPKYKFIFIAMKKNVNRKITNQGYGEKLYLRLVLNILKVIWSYLYLYPFGDLVQGSFHEGFHMPTDKKSFLKSFITILVNYELIKI
jgi:hypothetical protein